jgi:hypothetical protein
MLAYVGSIPWYSWSDFASASPRLAADVRALMELYGQCFGYLATVRRDGGPRLHPVSPVIAEGGLFMFVTLSPKRRDLERDGRYALHTYPAERGHDEAYLAGHAHPVHDELRRYRLARYYRAAPNVDWKLFEFDIDVAMVTQREEVGEPAEHRIWHAPL